MCFFGREDEKNGNMIGTGYKTVIGVKTIICPGMPPCVKLLLIKTNGELELSQTTNDKKVATWS